MQGASRFVRLVNCFHHAKPFFAILAFWMVSRCFCHPHSTLTALKRWLAPFPWLTLRTSGSLLPPLAKLLYASFCRVSARST